MTRIGDLPAKFEQLSAPEMFALRTTLEKLDTAISRLDTGLTEVQQHQDVVPPSSLSAIPMLSQPIDLSGGFGGGGGDYVHLIHAGNLHGRIIYDSSRWPYSTTRDPVTLTAAGQSYEDFGAGVALVNGNDTGWANWRLWTRIPKSVSGWKTKAIKVRYYLYVTGVDAGATFQLQNYVYDPITGGDVATKTYTHTESGGVINPGYPQEILFTAADLGPDWKEDYPLYIYGDLMVNNSPVLGFTALEWAFGPMEINWR